MKARVWGPAAVVVAMAGVACHGATKPRQQSATEPPPRKVLTGAVLRTGGGEAQVPGTVQARQKATLTARFQAAVTVLPFREGERVAAGTVLVGLDAGALRSAVAAAESGVATAEADRHRVDALLGRGAATPRESQEAASRAASARAVLEAARENLSYAVLRAPFVGVVTARPVHVGDVVAPGAPLLELEGDGGFEVRSAIDETLARALRPGLAVVTLVDGQERPLMATMRALSPAADPVTHRFELRADLPEAPGLRTGLFARLTLPSAVEEPRLHVPESALVRRGGLAGVFVVTDGRARLRWVALGETAGGRAEIRAGIDAGERVALDPAGLSDGVPVAEGS